MQICPHIELNKNFAESIRGLRKFDAFLPRTVKGGLAYHTEHAE